MKYGFYFLLLTLSLQASSQPGDVQMAGRSTRPMEKAAGNPDLKAKGFNRQVIGMNYRKEWMEPIEVPVLNFTSDFGGLKTDREGGGKQTHSLYLKDGLGREWVLRSVKKFPEKVVAPELKGTIAERLIHDGISASHPYGVLSVGTLARAAGIPYYPNTVVYIPDDPKLGEYRAKYGNTLSLFELRTLGDKDAKSYDTEEVIAQIQNSSDERIDQVQTLRARLLDNFIMDFDRHEGQWDWMERDSAGKKYFYPVAKDRDQAFFKASGFLPKKLRKIPSLGSIQGFRKNAKNINTFNYAARNFDRSFLNELDEITWSAEVDRFLSLMTDQVVDSAMAKQPQDIQSSRNAKIAEVLKARRDNFKTEMLQYYQFLSNKVSISASNGAEQITITKNEGGSVWVHIQKKDSSGETLFKRVFDPSITDEIRIYGLEGNDSFLILGERSPIKIRLIGGPGEDSFHNETGGKEVMVYDVSWENNSLTGGRLKNKINHDPLNNEYQRLGTRYSSSAIGLVPEYAQDGGLFLGLGFKRISYGFRKEPYAAKHNLFATKALTSAAYHVHYDLDLKTGRNTNLLFATDARMPTVRTRFYGYGNSSVLDKSKERDYYLAQYRLVESSLSLRHTLAPWFQVQYGPIAQYFRLSPTKNDDRYIHTIRADNGSGQGKWYAGGEFKALIDARNSELMPTRGIKGQLYGRRLVGFSGATNDLNQIGSSLSLYTDFIWNKHIVLATSFGFDHNSGDFEIPQAQYLGFRQNLRGYRYQRFAGQTRAYNNSEIRMNFGTLNLFFVKGLFGVLAFHDTGRVWMDEGEAAEWHKGYGGGIWIAPFNKVVISGVMMSSKEEKNLPFISFGFQF